MTIVRAAWAGTAVFGVVTAAAVAIDSLRPVAAAVAVVLFVAGVVVFLMALLRAARRSREDELSIGGVFLLQGSAPSAIRRHLLGSWVVQIVIAFVGAGLRPYTALAFGILAPVYGIGLAGLWGATHGEYGRRRRVPSA